MVGVENPQTLEPEIKGLSTGVQGVKVETSNKKSNEKWSSRVESPLEPPPLLWGFKRVEGSGGHLLSHLLCFGGSRVEGSGGHLLSHLLCFWPR